MRDCVPIQQLHWQTCVMLTERKDEGGPALRFGETPPYVVSPLSLSIPLKRL